MKQNQTHNPEVKFVPPASQIFYARFVPMDAPITRGPYARAGKGAAENAALVAAARRGRKQRGSIALADLRRKFGV